MKNQLKNYLLVGTLLLTIIFAFGCGAQTYKCGEDPNAYFPIAKGYFMNSFWDFLVYPMAWLMNFVGKLVNYNYAIIILITTILIRSLAWPIYGKTNDMTYKMNLVQPEMNKIEAKYKDKTDPESQRRKQMEQMALYKKYKINFLGCLLPFAQLPIFLSFYETLKRMPYTSLKYFDQFAIDKGDGTKVLLFENTKKGACEIARDQLLYNTGNYKTTIFGIDLLSVAKDNSGWAKWGIYVLAALVFLTQLGTQLLTQRRQKKQKAQDESNIPDYRKPQKSDTQKQTDMMLKIMTYAMPAMMIVLVINNSAALGFYWLVGNIYTGFQTAISAKLGAKKMAKLKEKIEKNNYWA